MSESQVTTSQLALRSALLQVMALIEKVERALSDLRRLRALIAEQLQAQGMTWEQIGSLAGVTRQRAQQWSGDLPATSPTEEGSAQ